MMTEQAVLSVDLQESETRRARDDIDEEFHRLPAGS